MICDLYLKQRVCSKKLKYLSLFDKAFSSEKVDYDFGYLGVNVERIRLVVFVVELRAAGVDALSVPVVYRDSQKISREDGFRLANDYAGLQGRGVASKDVRVVDDSPLFWVFTMVGGLEEKSGGVVRIDKVDGHVWSAIEYDEYMHDYLGALV